MSIISLALTYIKESFIFDVVIVVIFLSGLYYLTYWLCSCNPHEKLLASYGYSDTNGPSHWKLEQNPMKPENQSPINILSMCAITVPSRTVSPLTITSEYHVVPQEMQMVNDGFTVAIYPKWPNAVKPLLCGGPLCDEYKLFCLRFRWGHNDEEGSEHTIDMNRYGMELQITYNKQTCKCTDMSKSSRSCGVVIISYLFEVTPTDNPYLETIIHGLKYVQKACKSCSIRPVPLGLLAPAFTRNYFTYIGSLTYPPCTEGVRWIVQPEPLTVSPVQVCQFRKLIGFHGYLLSNARPVQTTNNRDVLLYD